MSVAHIEIQSPGAVPSQRLVKFKEFLHMPALGIFLAQSLDFRAQDRAQKTLIRKILFLESVSLNQFMVKRIRIAFEMIGLSGGGVTGPLFGEIGCGNFSPAFEAIGISRQGTEE